MARKRRDTRAAKVRESAPRPSAERVNWWSISSRAALVVLAVLSLAGLLARVINVWDHVFPEIGPVRLLGADPYFHLRHAQFFANHFPDLQRWDIGTHYPTGHRADAVSLFDVCIGSVAYCLGLGNPSERLIAIVAAWTPAVLGALSISVLYLLAQSVMSRPAALAASAIYLLYPGSSLHRSLLGFSDHHVAEILMGVLIAWGLTRCLQEAEGGKLVRSQV